MRPPISKMKLNYVTIRKSPMPPCFSTGFYSVDDEFPDEHNSKKPDQLVADRFNSFNETQFDEIGHA